MYEGIYKNRTIDKRTRRLGVRSGKEVSSGAKRTKIIIAMSDMQKDASGACIAV